MMFGPMVLGYAMGAIGVYALLYRFAPINAEKTATQPTATEVYTLYNDDGTLRHAA